MVIGRRKKQKPYRTTKEIKYLYDNDEYKNIIPYGSLGIGKSALAIKAVAELKGSVKEPEYERVKPIIVFHPQEFLELIMDLDGLRQEVIIWDDAGFWLHNLDFNSPFVKAVGKYMNVARTDFASIVFTAPLPTNISSKIRQQPDAIILKIIKTSHDDLKKRRHKYRLAKAFEWYVWPDMQHTGVKSLWEDDFDAMLDDDFFKWYKPYRDSYTKQAKQLMYSEFKKVIKDLPSLNLEKLDGRTEEFIEVKKLKKIED